MPILALWLDDLSMNMSMDINMSALVLSGHVGDITAAGLLSRSRSVKTPNTKA